MHCSYRRARYLSLLTSICLISSCFHLHAAVQTIDGANSPQEVTLNSDGQSNGVSFINQVIGQNTLVVPGQSTINTTKNTFGIQTDANGYGNINFNGDYGKTTLVFGKVGDQTPLFMDIITIGSITVNFGDSVHCKDVTFTGPGKANLNADLDLLPGGLVTFSNNSALSLNSGSTVSGNVGVLPAIGTIDMKDTSQINGNVIVGTLNVQKGKDSGSVINGNVIANSIKITNGTDSGFIPSINGNLETSEIFTDKYALFTQGNATLNNAILTVIQNDGGSVNVNGSTTINGPVLLHYTFKVHPRPTMVPLTFLVLTSNGGTSGANIELLNDPDIRMSFFTSNLNGEITLSNVPTSSVPVPPVSTSCPWWVRGFLGGCAGEVMLQLCPVADSYPGSDLDFVERQLSVQTWDDYWSEIYQIYPAQSLIGVPQESFNTAKQFQKIFTKHLNRDRCLCRRSLVDPSCGPCDSQERGVQTWIDGFGYFGRQRNTQPGKGYHANTWGTVFAADAPIARTVRAGLGAGYATTFLKKSKFIDNPTKRNRTNVDNYQGTFYLTHEGDPWFADTGFTFGWNRYHGKRFISFNELDRVAEAKYNGQEYTAFLTSGYQWCLKHVELTPLGTLTYSYLHLDPYQESGAKTLNLKIKKQNYEFLESSLGFKLAYLIETCYGSYVPEFHAFWLHEFLDRRVDVKASFSELGALGGYFTQTGPKTDEDRCNLGASITCSPGAHFRVLLDYDYEFGRTYSDHQGVLQFSYLF